MDTFKIKSGWFRSNAETFMQLLMTKSFVEDIRNPKVKTFNPKSCIYRYLFLAFLTKIITNILDLLRKILLKRSKRHQESSEQIHCQI